MTEVPQNHEKPLEPAKGALRRKLHEVIFEADTPMGKAFDVVLLLAIVLSVAAVMLESKKDIRQEWRTTLVATEWALTILFSIEYVLRLYAVKRPRRYAFSFFGIVDFLSIVPTYLSIFFAGSQALLVIRTFRLIRVFRIFKLHQYVNETHALVTALRATKTKISVFILSVMTTILCLGSAMYLVEGGNPNSGFTSIPKSVYWAIVTVTTVGYGDIAPQSPIGQLIAAIAMILGYSIIVVPTGIFSAEIIMSAKNNHSTQTCQSCVREGHDADASFCKFCGAKL